MNKKWIISVIFILLSFNLFSQNKEEIKLILNQNEQIYKNLEDDFKSIQMLVDVLKFNDSEIKVNANSIQDISNTAIIKINKLETNVEFLRKALISNNEDVGVIIDELGEMSNSLNEYKKYVNSIRLRMTRNEVLINTLIPITTLPLIGFGLYDMLNDQYTIGKIEVYSGLALFVGTEIIYNGGHFILKLW